MEANGLWYAGRTLEQKEKKLPMKDTGLDRMDFSV
jgi:hypothetical protein